MPKNARQDIAKEGFSESQRDHVFGFHAAETFGAIRKFCLRLVAKVYTIRLMAAV
jgi:hypothetical protein